MISFKDLLICYWLITNFPKIKTTEPKKYCVRPNQGIIGPQDSATATVILQPLDEELLSSSQGQHKFQILHTLKDDDVSLKSIEELWLSANHALVFHHKLRCYFETEIETQHRMKDKELQFNVSNLKDASNLVSGYHWNNWVTPIKPIYKMKTFELVFDLSDYKLASVCHQSGWILMVSSVRKMHEIYLIGFFLLLQIIGSFQITELRGKVDELKRQNTKLNISVSLLSKSVYDRDNLFLYQTNILIVFKLVFEAF